MARKAPANPTPPPPTAPPPRVLGPGLVGGGLLLLSLVTLLALVGIGYGRLNEAIATLLRWLVGWGAYPLTLLVGAVGASMLLRVPLRQRLHWGRVIALELLTLCALGLAAFWADPALVWASVVAGEGGGVVGWLVAKAVSPLGSGGGSVLLLLVGALLLIPLLGVPLQVVQGWLENGQQRAAQGRQRLLATPTPAPRAAIAPPRGAQAVPAPVSKPEAAAPASKKAPKREPVAAATPPIATPLPTPTKGKSLVGRVKEGVKEAVQKATDKPASAPARPMPASKPGARGAPYALPPLDLLQRRSGSQVDPNVARDKARVIEETLRHFGVPASVVQVNQGPAVTQFGIQPGFVETKDREGNVTKRKVKVSSITSLADDLALALSAKSIRVEAPVPGRPYVGIEVPNSDTEMVTLHSVLTSESYAKVRSDLAIALGRDVSGHPIAADLARMPHLLVAGATGSGKSVCINTIIASLLFNLGPDELKLLMIDPKMVELIPYNGIPHLVAPVVTDMERVVGALAWAMREMDNRYKLFSQAGQRNLEGYNRWAEAKGEAKLPFIVIIIDELADLMMVAADQVERIICRLAQMARATGMHLILATQRPSVDVVTGLIKANVPSRIAFAVASSIDSRVILDSVGAEALLGRGDMLYQAPDSGKLQRLQGCFVSDKELADIVQHWLRAPSAPVPLAAGEASWDDLVSELEAETEAEQDDDLLEEAIALVREHQWASTSFLQRKLRVGYTRAARLIDVLEARGIIGASEDGSSGSRTVLVAPMAEGESEE